jgi:hypothetical protein
VKLRLKMTTFEVINGRISTRKFRNSQRCQGRAAALTSSHALHHYFAPAKSSLGTAWADVLPTRARPQRASALFNSRPKQHRMAFLMARFSCPPILTGLVERYSLYKMASFPLLPCFLVSPYCTTHHTSSEADHFYTSVF